ncbi:MULTISPECIES: hypothetical protein [unclassified Pseudomonas]|uniref:hypothetical protein n=1 Tax=unclassified Pseudomonas TaxID=196821 RepID=UPI0024472228|nr:MULTISPECIES: hypothetical protein [unclassified Pseudomonas]MDH0304178.1 hypothetical protein [Pseudomonas sp. GD04091]MDH1986219.1 hypothetical protein [Pseudomonas sp. GD03689]
MNMPPRSSIACRLRVLAALDALPAQREQLLTEAYTNTKYPTAAALRFLHRHKLIKVEYARRDTSRNTSPFDEFKIIRLKASGVKKEQAIWAAHFHLSSQAAHLQDFTFAHLKLWPKRFQGHAYEVAKGERVHRGPLVREDITGIIPLT